MVCGKVGHASSLAGDQPEMAVGGCVLTEQATSPGLAPAVRCLLSSSISHTSWIPAFLNPSQCVGTSPTVSPTETHPSSTDTPHRANRPFNHHVLACLQPASIYSRPVLQRAAAPQPMIQRIPSTLVASRSVNSNGEI